MDLFGRMAFALLLGWGAFVVGRILLLPIAPPWLTGTYVIVVCVSAIVAPFVWKGRLGLSDTDEPE